MGIADFAMQGARAGNAVQVAQANPTEENVAAAKAEVQKVVAWNELGNEGLLEKIAPFIPVVGPFVAAALKVDAAVNPPEGPTLGFAPLVAQPPQRSPTMFEDFSLPSVDWSGVLNTALQARMQRDQQRTALQLAQMQPIPDAGPIGGGFGGGMTPAAFPAALPFLGRLIPGAAGAAGAIVRRGGMLITAAGRAISSRKAVQLAKVLGVQGAATALGIGAVELAEAVLSDQKRGRRGKGVTAAALKTTRRTMNTVERMHRQIAGYCRDAGVRNTKVVRVPVAAKRCR